MPKFNLWVHDERFSKLDLIIVPDVSVGDLLEISVDNKRLILQVAAVDNDLISKQSQLQISIAQHISQLYEIPSRINVNVQKVASHSIAASHIEILFKDQYAGRSDMWELKHSLVGTAVYTGKKVSSLGMHGTIRDIYVNSHETCGFVTSNTKIIFRSSTAKCFVLIQMSKEMWEYDEDGELYLSKCVYGFMQDLFDKWKTVGANHVVSIILFARVFAGKLIETHHNESAQYHDFYRVVVDWETMLDWNPVLTLLNHECNQFQRHVLEHQGPDVSLISGRISAASQGNIMEAINLALNPFDKHYLDRDLSRTGLNIVVVTPGTGVFDVSKPFFRITTQRLTDNGITVDLVCLSKQPLHVTPLVYTDSQSVPSSKFDQNDEFSEKRTTGSFHIPSWIYMSYWTKPSTKGFIPRCKMYEVQVMKLFDYTSPKIHLPYLELDSFCAISKNTLTFDFDSYDDLAFGGPETTAKDVLTYIDQDGMAVYEDKIAESPSLSPYHENTTAHLTQTAHIEPIKIQWPSQNRGYSSSLKLGYSTSDKAVSPKPENIKKSPIRNSYMNKASYNSRQVNPWNPKRGMNRGDLVFDRWEHLSPSQDYNIFNCWTNWKSLCTPACLPLTTEHFPTISELATNYQEYTYVVSPNDDDLLDSKKVERFLLELIRQRLAQGFQIIVSRTEIHSPMGVTDARGTSQEPNFYASKQFNLSLGDHVHKLFFDASGKNIQVKRYLRKDHHSDTQPILYTCSIWPTHSEKYEPRSIEFSYPPFNSYNWNYLDHLISGYQEQISSEALRFWRTRFLLIPSNIQNVNMTNEKETFDEEEIRLAGFTKFLECFQKAQLSTDNQKAKSKPLSVIYTTFNLSSYIKNEIAQSSVSSPSQITVPSSEKLSMNSNLSTIVNCMLQPGGLSLRDRRWHFRVYDQSFVGSECVDWLLTRFQDIQTREAAVEFGNRLFKLGIFEHVSGNHGFLGICTLIEDGFYFYRVVKMDIDKEENKETSRLPKWFYKKLRKSTLGYSYDSLLDQQPEDQSSEIVMTAKFKATKQILLDMDPLKKSNRREVAVLHYDTTHNPRNCYHFQIHWIVCTARLIDDLIHSWMRYAEKCGLKLVEAPLEQAERNGNNTPFQSLIPISLALNPPEVYEFKSELQMEIPEEWFLMELLKDFNFVMDVESDRFVPQQMEHSFQRKPWPYTQFVHKTGFAFVQILEKGKGFLWVNNRLHLSNANFRSTNIQSPDGLLKDFAEFCSSRDRLRDFWGKTEQRLKKVLNPQVA